MQISFLGHRLWQFHYAGAYGHRAGVVPTARGCCWTRVRGNSVLRHAGALGIDLQGFDDVLLSHDHPDHMAGLVFVQFDRTLSSDQQAAPARPRHR